MSGLDSAIASAVSGLNAQGVSIADISQNIANADTTGYKSNKASFESLVTGSGASASGVVTSATTTNLKSQGSISSTGVSTNLAIQGSGFFIVNASTNTSQTSSFAYTRNGDFATDKNGFLINNEGEYLLGQATLSDGTVSSTKGANALASLEAINVNAIKGAASATANLSIGANLPANAAISPATPSAFTTSTQIFDTQGQAQNINQTFTKTGNNTWTMAVSNPVSATDSTITTGALVPNLFDITFNADGTIATVADDAASNDLGASNATSGPFNGGVDPSAIPLTITFNQGTGNNTTHIQTVTLNLGKKNTADQLTQHASTTSTAQVEVSGVKQDGLPPGKLIGVAISGAGLVTAAFDNGLKQPVYQIPLGTFDNPNGMTLVGGTVYASSIDSGPANLTDPGTGVAGSIQSSALESSDTDTTTSLSQLVTSQQSYNAAAKVISTVSAMFTSLIQAI